MLKSAGLENAALWLMRKTFRNYRSGKDTLDPGYPRFNYNYGKSLLERGFIRNPVTLADDHSNFMEWKRHADQNAFEFLGRAYNQGRLLSAGGALASLMALRGEVGRAMQLADELADAASSSAAKSDLCDVAIFSATIYDIVGMFHPGAAQLIGCLDRTRQLGDEPHRAILCIELGGLLANAREPANADNFLAEGASVANRLGLDSVLLHAAAVRGLRLLPSDPEAAVKQLREVRDVLRAQDDVPLYARVDLNEPEATAVAIKGRHPLLCRVLLDLAAASMFAADNATLNQTLDDLDDLTVEWFPGYCPHYYLIYAECLMLSDGPENRPMIQSLLGRARQVGDTSGNPWVEQAVEVLERRLKS